MDNKKHSEITFLVLGIALGVTLSVSLDKFWIMPLGILLGIFLDWENNKKLNKDN